MKKATRTSLVDFVVEQLHEQITSGKWTVGDRIPPESELMQSLSVSRASVRAGVQSLVHAGLLATRQGDGTFVVATDATDVAVRRRLARARHEHVIQLRNALDVAATRLAAVHRTTDDLAALEAALAARADAFDRGDQEAFVDADIAFHMAVATASANPVLSELYRSLHRSLVDAMQHSAAVVEAEHDEGRELHARVLEAIRSNDHEAALALAIGLVDPAAWSIPDDHA